MGKTLRPIPVSFRPVLKKDFLSGDPAYAADLDRAVRLGQRNQAPGARRALLSDEINCPDAG
jgi:hypothetical protein